MASVGEGDCHKDPNFAVVCSFLDKYGASLGLEPISYSDLQKYLEDTTGDVSRVLIDIHVRLLRRIGKSIVNSDRFEKSIIKFCHHFSEFDAWEVESYGYKHAQLATKLKILKNLLECQFDYNLKFKEKINGQSAEEMRFIPIGRDKEGQAYWYFLDHEMNLLVYKEEQDDEVADTWKLVCRNRRELASLVSSLQDVKEQTEDKASTCESRSSKEGSPDKDVNAEDVNVKDTKLAQEQTVNVKEEETSSQEQALALVKDKKIAHEQVEVAIDNKVAHGQAEVVKKEKIEKEKIVTKETANRRQLVVVLKRGKSSVQEQEVDVKEEKVVEELVDVKKEKTCPGQETIVEKDGKSGTEQEMDVGKVCKAGTEQEVDVGKVCKAGKEQKIDDRKVCKAGTEQEVDVGKVCKAGTEQEIDDGKVCKAGTEQEVDVGKVCKAGKEQKIDDRKVCKAGKEQEMDDGKASKEQEMDVGKEVKTCKEHKMDVEKEAETGKEQEMDVGKERKTSQEQKMDVGEKRKTGKEQKMDVEKEAETGKEQKMDVGKEAETGKEQEMDVGKERKTGKEQKMDVEKEVETGKEQEMDVGKERKTGKEQKMDVEKEAETGKEQKMDVEKEAETGKEQKMDVEKEVKTGKEQKMDVEKEVKTGKEQKMDVGKEGNSGQEQAMDGVKDLSGVQAHEKGEQRSKEQEMDIGRAGEADPNQVEDVVKKKIDSSKRNSSKSRKSPLPNEDSATPSKTDMGKSKKSYLPDEDSATPSKTDMGKSKKSSLPDEDSATPSKTDMGKSMKSHLPDEDSAAPSKTDMGKSMKSHLPDEDSAAPSKTDMGKSMKSHLPDEDSATPSKTDMGKSMKSHLPDEDSATPSKTDMGKSMKSYLPDEDSATPSKTDMGKSMKSHLPDEDSATPSKTDMGKSKKSSLPDEDSATPSKTDMGKSMKSSLPDEDSAAPSKTDMGKSMKSYLPDEDSAAPSKTDMGKSMKSSLPDEDSAALMSGSDLEVPTDKHSISGGDHLASHDTEMAAVNSNTESAKEFGHCADRAPPSGKNKLTDLEKMVSDQNEDEPEDEPEEDSSVDIEKKTSETGCGNERETQKFSEDVAVKQTGAMKVAPVVDLKQPGETKTIKVEMEQRGKMKVALDEEMSRNKEKVSSDEEMSRNKEKVSSDEEMSQNKKKLASDEEMSQNKEKVASIVETNQDKTASDAETMQDTEKVASDAETMQDTEKVASDAETMQDTEKVASDAEAMQDTEKVASDVEAMQDTEKVASDAEAMQDTEKVAANVKIDQEEKTKVTAEVEVNCDETKVTSEVEVNQEETKVTLEGEVNSKETKVTEINLNRDDTKSTDLEGEEEKATSDVEVNREEAKATSDVEVNREEAKATSDVEVNREEAKATSDVEVNQDQVKATSDVEVNQDQVKATEVKVIKEDTEVTSEVKEMQIDATKATTDDEVNHESTKAAEVEVSKEKAKAAEVEVGREEAKAAEVEVSKEKAKAAEVEVGREEAKVLSKVKTYQVDETKVTGDEASHEKRQVSLDVKVNQEDTKATLESNTESHCEDLSKGRPSSDESTVAATADLCETKDSQITQTSTDFPVHRNISDVATGSSDVSSVDSSEDFLDKRDKSQDMRKSKASLRSRSKLTHQTCQLEHTDTEGCHDSDKITDKSITCKQAEDTSKYSGSIASDKSTEDSFPKVENKEKVKITLSEKLDGSCNILPTQSTGKDVDIIQSSSGPDDKLECLEQTKKQNEPEKESLPLVDLESNAKKKESTHLPCEKVTLRESHTDNDPGDELPPTKKENVESSENIGLGKTSTSGMEESLGKDDQLVNGHLEKKDPVINTDMSEDVPTKVSVNCDADKTEGDVSKNNRDGIIEHNGLPAEEIQADLAVGDDTPTNSKKPATNETPKSKSQSRRQLKRAVPEPASDDPVDSEPNGKRARQATKTQKTRGGRNAAVRGRAARLATKDTESEDSEAPLSQVRDRGQGLARGLSCRITRNRANQMNQANKANQEPANKANQEPANKANQEPAIDDDGEEGISGKRGKKKKPDSSSEALSEEEVTPAKKGRNQAQQSSNACKAKSFSKGKGGNVAKKPIAKPASAPAAEEEAGGIRRSMRVRQLRARRPPTPSSPSEETSEDEDSSEEDEEEEDHDKNFLDASFTPEEEESGDEDFRPKGRNFQRQAARTSQEDAVEVVNDDTPCVKCGKYNHPEMILLCDKCDAGYHTACLRPPLMLIPDGDWFCPPCEHSRLVEKLLECLQSFDVSMKKKDRLNKRQERLAFVGISISNILHGGRKMTPQTKSEIQGRHVSNRQDHLDRDSKADLEESVKQEESANSSSNESEPEPKITYRSERLALRQAQKRSCRDKHKSSRRRRKRSPEVEVLSQRTCRTRAAVSYQFKEFDELISNAIEDDKPYRREKPPGISRGKDMSNILGASDEEDEKIRQRDGDSGLPPPVVRKKTKRRLTRLDSDEEPDEEDSDEFQISEDEDSDATECEGDEDAENEEVGSSDSGDWRPQKTWYNSHTSSRRTSRKLQNFVVEDDDYNSDENANKRRSTRNSNRGRIHYSDWDSNEEETEPEASLSEGSSANSLYPGRKSQKQRSSQTKKKVTTGKKKAKNSDNTDSDSSITIKRKNLRKIIKKRRKDASESEDSQNEAENAMKEMKKKKPGKIDSEDSDFVLGEESQEDSDDSPKFKKKNVLRSSEEEEEEEEQVDDGETLKPAVEAAETVINTDSTSQVEAVPKVDDVPEVEALPAPEAVVEPQKVSVTKSKPKATAKGKKRNDRNAEDKVTVSVADVAVPGKVRKVSSSDREPDAVPEIRPQLPVPVISAPVEEKIKQETKLNSTDVQESERFQQDQKPTCIAGGKGCEASQPTDKVSSGGKKRTVPNFLDVNSGEESDEQRQDLHKDAAVPPYIADITNAQATVPSQSPSDSGQARVEHLENHPQHRNFSHAGQHYPFGVRSYNNPVQGDPRYPQHQVMGSPQNLEQVRHDAGPPPHNSSLPNQSAHNGPPGLIQGFPDQVTQHSNTGPGNTAAPDVRGAPPFIGRGPRPRHPYPQGLLHSSPQSMEHGQTAPNVNQEHHMSHPGFQGLPGSHHAPPGPTGGHVRPGMVQQHCGGMQPFFMGQQQHAHQNMESDSGPNMGGYIPQNYGSRRMPSAQEMGASGIRNPYYGMQSSPPHSMGRHLVRQYPGNMGTGPHMSSPLTSMGQMARNLGSGANMHSPPNTQPMGGCEERRSSLGSPPNQDSIHRQEKVSELRDVKTECDMDDSPEKRLGKAGKKRAASSKSKKKSSEPTSHSPGLPQHLKQGSHGANEAKDRVPEPGQIIGGYRGTGQPYHMLPYQMPYSHGSVANVNPQPGTQGSYMNPRHTPPALAQQRSNTDGNNTHSKDGEGKWNRTDNPEGQPTSMTNASHVEQRLKMSPYQQNLHKSQPKGQSAPTLERRHSQSPVHQGSDASAANHSQEPPSSKPINMRAQEAGMEPNPHSQILPPAAHSSDISPNSQDGSSRSMASGQTMAPSAQDHSMRASSHRHNHPPYSQGSGGGAPEPSGPYYSAGPYSSPYGPNPNQPMSQNSAWGPDIQRYGPRYGPHVYPYVMNPANPGNRMPSGKPLYGSHGPPGSDLTDTKGPAATQDPCIKEEPGKKPKGGEPQGPVVNRRSSTEYQMTKSTEPGHIYPKNLEQDIKPFFRHSDPGMEGENLCTTGSQRSQPVSESVASLSTSSATTSPSASTHTVSHLSEGMPSASVSKQSSSTDQSSFQQSTSSNMSQSHQVSPATSMAPRSTWTRPSTAAPYAHQHMAQWPNMGSPGHYGMARPYGGPGAATRSPYGMDPQAGPMRPNPVDPQAGPMRPNPVDPQASPMRPNPGHADQKPFMYQAYDLRFQSSHPNVGPGGSETEYHRSGFNQDYPPPGRFPQQYQSAPRNQDGSSHQAGHAGIDQATDGSTVSKPKRAKTQKKTGKDGSGPVRGKSGRGRGRGRGGFMIDNLLQAQGGEIDDEQGEDSAEINDIVSYVTTDEYFKQQTSAGSFPRQAEVGLGGEKK